MVNLIDVVAREVAYGRTDNALRICREGLGWSYWRSLWIIKQAVEWISSEVK